MYFLKPSEIQHRITTCLKSRVCRINFVLSSLALNSADDVTWSIRSFDDEIGRLKVIVVELLAGRSLPQFSATKQKQFPTHIIEPKCV